MLEVYGLEVGVSAHVDTDGFRGRGQGAMAPKMQRTDWGGGYPLPTPLPLDSRCLRRLSPIWPPPTLQYRSASSYL